MAIECDYTVVGNGPPLICIHGIGARRTGFARIIDRLKDRFTCVSFDLRGHGASPVPKERFGLEDLVDDVEALRAKLGFEKVHLAGHSLGGQIGPAYARRYPDRLFSLTMLSTAAFRTAEDKAKISALGNALREEGIPKLLDAMTLRWFSDAFAAEHPDVISRRAQQVLETPPEIFLNVFDIYAQTEMSSWLPEIVAPTLIITGELDGGCPPRLNRLIADAMPNSELIILDGLKHAITLEAPERVAGAMEPFLLTHSDISAKEELRA
jgi:3-oxoadipate enol-lactonase